MLEEFIEGDTLGFLLKDSLFTQDETREIVRQVCRALWVLHSIGAVHRDVKPENIIMRGKEAVLIDFDAARLHKPELSTDTHVLGTTGFAAPEQYGLSQSDLRTDIYSLGILINVMLTGEHPSKKLAEGRLGRVVDTVISEIIAVYDAERPRRGKDLFDEAVEERTVREVVIPAAGRDQLVLRAEAQREKRQAHVVPRLVRRAQLKRLAGDALHHPYVLRFQVCAGEVQHEPEDDAQHDGHDAHVDDHEFDTQFFYHSCSTSR